MNLSRDSILRTCCKTAAVLFLMTVLTGCVTNMNEGGSLPLVIPIEIGQDTYHLEVASDDGVRKKGLSERDSLGEYEGMLFLFDAPQIVSFWMKDTSLELSLAWIDEQGMIIGITDLIPYSIEPVFSPGPVIAAIELNRGSFTRSGAQLLDQIALPE